MKYVIVCVLIVGVVKGDYRKYFVASPYADHGISILKVSEVKKEMGNRKCTNLASSSLTFPLTRFDYYGS